MGLGSCLLLFLHSDLCFSWLSAHGGKWNLKGFPDVV